MCRKTLPTLGGRSSFDYTGSVKDGTKIWFGKEKKNTARITWEAYAKLLEDYRGQTILVGNGRRNRPLGSLGAWLQDHVTRAVVAAYVAKILIEEGYGEKVEGPAIYFYSEMDQDASICPPCRLNS